MNLSKVFDNNFLPGTIVRFKTVEELCAEYKVDRSGCIHVPLCFTKEMYCLCGKTYVVVSTNDYVDYVELKFEPFDINSPTCTWYISSQMVKKVYESN